MTLLQHAKKELELAGLFDKDSDYNGDLGKAVMELVKVFSEQGHGASAHMVVSLFKKVALYENLTPLTGEDNEWNDVGGGCLQNNRVSSVFKETGKSYYLDAIIWRTQSGSTWTGNAEEVSSRQFIKSFPFTPKTFYVDVIDINGEFMIKDRKQLGEVFEYYEGNKESRETHLEL